MKREEYENPMIRPFVKPEYSMRCDVCGSGIPSLGDYYHLPTGPYGLMEIWCGRCFREHMSYAKHNTKCIWCGEDIEEDDDCFVSDDAECICMGCLPERPSLNSD